MWPGWNGRAGHYALLTATAAILFFINLGGASLWDLDEGRNATAALEMAESGNWIVPTFNAKLRVDKPALLYWCQAAAYQLFGVNEFAARLPCALAALLTVLLCYELARSMFRASTGLMAGLMAASTPMLCGAARFANPDALLTCFSVLALLLFWMGQRRGGASWFLGLGAAVALAVLAKGPVGMVLPGAVILLFLSWERRLQLLLDRRWRLALAAFLLVALPWHILVAVHARADFLEGFFLRHNVGRFLSTMENHDGTPLYYLLVLLCGLAPWSVFVGMTCWCAAWSMIREPWSRYRAAWEAAADRTGEGTDIGAGADVADRTGAYRFLGVWIGIWVLFFTLAATKLPNYILPAAIPFIVLTARFLDRWRLGTLRAPAWAMPASLVCLTAIGVASGLGFLAASGSWALPFTRNASIPSLELWALVGVVPVGTAGVSWWFLRRRRADCVIASLLLGAVVFLGPLAAWGSAAFNRVKAVRPLVEKAGALQRSHDIRVGCWQLEHLPSLNFYVQRDVVHHSDRAAALAFLRFQVPVFLFLPAEEWQELRPWAPAGCRELACHRDLYRSREVVVVTNR